ncbi:putative receptor-like protein kinase At4g00960 [Triticum aestivum]|uniref:putative receptor-like protein kinase At4g00960 n=1 Tax=Triticum aestivum TaxID=4565 RepID=UPI001D007263|nr:putative receptor-like protein kinase At4g00960 [Triticum aestivum]
MWSVHGELEKKLQDSNATPMSLPLEFLEDITCDFSTESVLGEGGYVIVYKGVLRSGKIIAVKKLFEMRLKEETFHNEVSNLMGIKHQNVVQFIGYCAESRWEAIETPSGSGKHVLAEIPKRLLCFEYISNKSLEKHISDESLGLEWNMRYKIIKGICSGMHFLHDACHIVHLDLKPENILIDSTMTPKIADFGLSRIFGEQESRIVTDNRAGTCGYMAPEYLIRGVVSNKADIFSVGVIVIEIITGHRDYPYFQQDNPHSTAASLQQFTEKVLLSWRNKFISTPNYKSTERSIRQVRQCICIALECVDPGMEKRPTPKDILEMLNGVDKMVANDELQSDMHCKDMLQALNTTVSNDPTSQNRSITNDMLNKETDSKLVANVKSVEGLSLTPLPESNKISEIVKGWAEKASSKPQPTSDTTIVQAIPALTQIISREIPKKRMVSLDVNLTESWIATGHEDGYIDICDYIMQKSICFIKTEEHGYFPGKLSTFFSSI